MIIGQNPGNTSLSLSKFNEDINKLISLEKKKSEENHNTLNNIFNEEEELNNNIPADIDKKIFEMVEKRDFELANSKKNKFKKKGLDLLNEQLEDLIKKTMNESKTDTKNSDSLSKRSKEKRKKLIKHRISDDEENNISHENNNNSITLIMGTDKSNYNYNYTNIDDDSSNYGDENELMEFLNKKTCSKKNLKKYKEKYEKMKKNKNKIIIFDSDDDSEKIKENKNIKNIELNNNKNEKKHLKRLKKNTDNKEMKLPLDTECIICTCIIKELANPDGCNHDFCKSCLIEWSQRSSKCPMCKKLYNNIIFYENGIKKQMSLNEIRKDYYKNILNENNNESDNESNIDEGCYICGKNTDQCNLLVCERCKGNFCHYYCINLNKIPEGKWYCEYCIEEMKEIRMNKKKVEQFFL
jgi:hypothetical protein